MIWNESIECMDRESLRKIQSIRLKKIVEHVYHNTPFYRKKMQELGITPDDINSIDDIVKLPFTTKYDLRDNYPFGLCAVPMSQIVRIHASSGTTGKPSWGIPVRTCRRGRNVYHVPLLLMELTARIFSRCLMVMVCLPVDWGLMPELRISEHRLFPCQVAIQKNKLL